MNDATSPGNLAGTPSYRVLARKYRPSSFADLIGQDAMVRTVSNAFETGRIPQAWILTGVRGVGKTTTARILARALNYELPDGSVKGPTIQMPVLGLQCQAIMESRHVDVIEMDAASHNGVDDVRQINEAVRYSPVSARYKVYILDEVHMFTPQAFNALLKTLEEPPPHVKFVFATTDIRKVPITILSRCQRFDLRRVDAALLVRHLETICAKEGISAEPGALALIARAAEGSVRDALSLMDQGIAHAAGGVRAEDVRQMLGLADRTRIIDLFEALMRGDMAKALGELRDQYDSGADPAVVLSDLAEFTHFVTRVKVVPAVADDPSFAETERTRGRAFATQLSMRVLSRTWQMLFKGLTEMKDAGKPLAAAEMVLVRIAYAADLPTPDEVIRDIQNGAGSAPPNGALAPQNGALAPPNGPLAPPSGAPRASAAPRFDPPRGAPRASLAPAQLVTAQLPDVSALCAEGPPTLAVAGFAELIALAAERRDLATKSALERDVRLVRFEEGKLEIALEPSARKTLVNDLSRKLSEWTGKRWMVVVSAETGAPTVQQQTAAQQNALEQGVRADPLVKAVLARFPGAEIVGVRRRDEQPSGMPPEGDEPLPNPDDYGAGEMDDDV
jgi:DNA polymerase-3 subunit gamma/tau